MTLQENLNQHFEKLPLHLRAEVLDFVLFLEQRHNEAARKSLEAAYREMAQDEAAEAEALEWSEAMIGDVGDEPW